APVIFLLRMHERVAVAFAGGGDEEGRIFRLREAKGVVRAERADLQRRDGMLEIIDRRRGRGEVENKIDLVGHEDVIRDVVPDELVVLVAGEVLDVRDIAGKEIVHANDAMALGEEAVGEMRAEKTGAARDKCGGTFRGHGSWILRKHNEKATTSCKEPKNETE